MEAAKPKVASSGNIRTRPDHVSMETEKSLRPVAPPPDSPLKLKFVCLKQDLLVCAYMPWNFLAIQWRQNRIADANRFCSLNWSP
jgi:hypothetical protein